MASVLNVHDMSMAFVERSLFSFVSFEIQKKDKVGFIGANGVGKTTILKILCGTLSPDSGAVSFARDTRVGYMEQHACSTSKRTVYDEVLSVFEPLMNMQNQIDMVTKELESSNENTDELILRQTRLIESFERDGGLTYKSRAKSALMGLGFAENELSHLTDTLSGGQRSKISLCKLLLSDANLLLLDEPTNHLDISSVQWLESFLKDFRGEMIIISHDRYFLDAVTNKTIELEHGKITCYTGNYSEFVKKKEHEQEAVKNKYIHDVREINRIEGIVEQQKRFGQAHNFITAASKQKEADRIKAQLVTPDSELETLSFRLEPQRESSNDVLICENLSKSFSNKKVFENVSMHIRKGEKIFIIGANGCGKTTLFKILTKTLYPDSGDIRMGTKTDIGYFDQMQSDLCPEKTAFDEVYDAFPHMTVTQIRTMLGRFMFKGDDVFKTISTLSGGERARISLLKLMLKRGNFLLLDEPTNHLDTTSCEALEKALSDYKATMLIISHDRYFINKLCNRLLELNNDGMTEYLGNYDYYAEHKRISKDSIHGNNSSKPTVNDYKRSKQQKSDERKRRTQLEKCEQEIERLEQLIAEKTALSQSEDLYSDYEKLTLVFKEIDELHRELEECYKKWEYLEK